MTQRQPEKPDEAFEKALKASVFKVADWPLVLQRSYGATLVLTLSNARRIVENAWLAGRAEGVRGERRRNFNIAIEVRNDWPTTQVEQGWNEACDEIKRRIEEGDE